jgi:hypothetical protein
VTTWCLRRMMASLSLIALGGLLAMPLTAHASGPFDINTLPVDEENRFSNVGAFIVAVVDDDGNPVGRVAHCSGVLIQSGCSSRRATAQVLASSRGRRSSPCS